jgi:transcriptional regulator with XRE-family HTH domain
MWVCTNLHVITYMYHHTMSEADPPKSEKVFGIAVGREMARRRAECELSGNTLAGRSGVSVDTIRSIEIGRISSPGLYAMSRLTAVLGVSLDAIAAAGSAAIGSSGTQKPDGTAPPAPKRTAGTARTRPRTMADES